MISILSFLILVYFLINGIELLLSKVPTLDNVIIPEQFQNYPKISIIIPARNEEKNIGKSIATLLNINYPNKEIIVVNDRSTDKTSHILKKIALANENIRIVHNNHLPDNWMGKNYAMHLGAENALGEWLLFTDADIFYHADTFTKAIFYALSEHSDHLTLQPKFNCISMMFGIVMTVFSTSFALQKKPWRANSSNSKKSMGVGAFNLIKHKTYNAIGGHSALKMNTDDDLKLGQLVKENGYKQSLVNGINYISVDWYASVKEMILGLEKNSFAICNYNAIVVIIFLVITSMLYFFPLINAFSSNRLVSLISIVTIGFTILLHMRMSKSLSYNPLFGLLYPIGVLISMYILLRSMLKIIISGSVSWRDTKYPLAYVKKYHIKTKF